MSNLSNRAYRAYLRIFCGRENWHKRYYRPSVHVVDSGEQLWFEEAGRVVEALPLRALKSRFEGRCNVLLSGPSVRSITQLERVAENDWIGVNGSPAALGDKPPRMRIYHVNDTTYLRNSLEAFLRFAALAEYTVIDFRAMYELLRLVGDALPQTTWVVYDCWAYPLTLPLGKIQAVVRPPEYKGIHWSPDLGWGLATGGTVAYTAAQIAWHAGYGSLYFYGLDLTDSGRSYREDASQPQMLDKSFERVIQPAFELMVRETKDSGFEVFNCNPHSRLSSDVIPQLNPEDSFS